jgi:mannose-6-phosphate isomerase-like protein (cupin superfamily)
MLPRVSERAAMSEPIVVRGAEKRVAGQPPIAAVARTLVVHEWTGGGPDYLHVHHADDEAWHVLEGTLTFRFRDREIEAGPGATVFVPAGVPHA